jgi:hypothetical protein
MKTLTSLKDLPKAVNAPLRLSESQMKAYKRLCYGLRDVPQEELKSMSEEQKRTILYNNNKFWQIVNSLKQLKMAAFIHRIYFRAFPQAPVTEAVEILCKPVVDQNFSLLNLRELNIDQELIIRECIKLKLLPSNFLL